ncbi:methyltransferase, partial [Salmonella enterica subsp. enterica serovar Kentucky]|nr:methyltransferase [Salmonella enterica subsp. enterica serovar Kentucky]
GNGVIGLSLLAKNPQANVVFVDESPMAVDSSRLNVETNLPEAAFAASMLLNEDSMYQCAACRSARRASNEYPSCDGNWLSTAG